MPDLLSHALLAYSICVVLSWRYAWLSPAYLTVGMAGAFIPDVTKIQLLLPGTVIEAWLGIPFSWGGIHTLGGALIGIAIGSLLVTPRERRRVGALLAIGAGSHLFADALLLKPSGYSYAVFWPLTQWHPPTPGLYLSTQPEPTVVLGLVAIALTMWTRRRQ